MPKIRYEVVQHDDGWAYKVDDVFSETFPTHDDALAAAQIAANHHQIPGSEEEIEYQDATGQWHEQISSGSDRPQTEVVDLPQRNMEMQPDRADPLRIFLLTTTAVLAATYLFRLFRRR